MQVGDKPERWSERLTEQTDYLKRVQSIICQAGVDA